MADENEVKTEVEENEEVIEETGDGVETESGAETTASTEPVEPDIVITIGDEPAPEEEAAAPDWVRDLRKKNREDQRRIKELEAQLKTTTGSAQVEKLGKKPSLSDDGIDYDEARYEAALDEWKEKQRKITEREQAVAAQAQAAQEAWQSKLTAYGKAREALKVKDYDDAEAAVLENLNEVQQGIIIQGAENPALVVYALGKNPKKAQELAAITDPVQYAFAIAKLETQLKVTQKKPPAPEKVIIGTGRISGSVDSALDQLREEAAKTGDMSKVMEYKRNKKAAG